MVCAGTAEQWIGRELALCVEIRAGHPRKAGASGSGITCFTGLYDAVSAAFQFTTGGAAVIACFVTVIACFSVRYAERIAVVIYDAVAAPAFRAVRPAEVADGIGGGWRRTSRASPVALFRSLLDAVTALLHLAGRRAAVIIVFVAVVASLGRLFHAVAAGLQLACHGAAVIRYRIAVIALLVVVGLQVGIAAHLDFADLGTTIIVIGVAVVAFFPRLFGAIPTFLHEAGAGAPVIVPGIVIITLLPGLQCSVAAGLQFACGRTAIIAGVVPVIAGFA